MAVPAARRAFVPYGPWPCCSCCAVHGDDFPGHRLPCTEVEDHTLAQVADALESLDDPEEA